MGTLQVSGCLEGIMLLMQCSYTFRLLSGSVGLYRCIDDVTQAWTIKRLDD